MSSEFNYTRRDFIKSTTLAAASVSLIPSILWSQKPRKQWGVALVSGFHPNALSAKLSHKDSIKNHPLKLIDLDSGKALNTFYGLMATHAVTPIERLNRFIVHGLHLETGQGGLLVVDVDPTKKTWSIQLETQLKEGPVLHWQPSSDGQEIVFNTIKDGSLHVLNVETLEIKKYPGGGKHSNMAFFDNYLIATDQMAGPTQLNIINRATSQIDASISVGRWGHGVTVSQLKGEAFVWMNDGIHVVSLAKKSLGKPIKFIEPFKTRERGWFCWTPQGGRYSHDTSWNPGDRYGNYLSVIDMHKRKLEKIQTPEHHPVLFQSAPDGSLGLASLQNKDEVALFDLKQNTFQGTIPVGKALPSFFDRDMSFLKDRQRAIVTNTRDKSLSLVNLIKKQQEEKISLDFTPLWMKALG